MTDIAFRRIGRRLPRVLVYVLLAIGALAVLLPFLWMLRTVILPDPVLYKTGSSLSVIPRQVSFEHFRNVWSGDTGTPFYRYLFNSVIVTTIATFSNVVFCGLGGFALARGRFRGHSLAFGIIVVMLAIPLESRVIPLYVMVGHTPLADSRLGVALPLLVTSTGLFLMRQYVLSVPREVDEAAYLDGCSSWRLYWSIIFPICRPVLAVIAIFSAVTAWNDFLWPLVIINSGDEQTLPLAIANLASIKEQLRWGEMLTSCLLSLLPVLVLYIALQRQFISGLTGGAVKG
jgi:ABC-type glycerol-3-phosphate transport system permease component